MKNIINFLILPYYLLAFTYRRPKHWEESESEQNDA